MSHQQRGSELTFRAGFTVFVVALYFFYAFGLNNIFNPIEAPLERDFHLSSSAMGWVSSVYFYADILVLLPAGILVDRFSPRRIIAASLLICSAGVWLTSVSHDMWSLILGRFLMGVGSGACFVGPVKVASNWFPSHRLAVATGFIVTMGMLGGFMVQAPMIMLSTALGWRRAMFLVAMLGFALMIIIYLFVHDMPKRHESVFAKGRAELSDMGVFASLKLALSQAQNWFCAIYTSLMNLPIYLLGALWGITYMTQTFHLTLIHSATVMGMMFLGTMLGSPVVGWISNRIVLRCLPMMTGAVSSAVIIIVIMNLSQDTPMWVLRALFFALGFTSSTQVISYPTVAESNPLKLIGTATSLVSMISLLGGAIVEPAFGFILDMLERTQGNQAYRYGMLILPAAFLLAMLMAYLIRETNCRHQSDDTLHGSEASPNDQPSGQPLPDAG